MVSWGAFFFLPEDTAQRSLLEGPQITSLPFPYCIWFHSLCIYLAYPFEVTRVGGNPCPLALGSSVWPTNEALTPSPNLPQVPAMCSCTRWPWSYLMAGRNNQLLNCLLSHSMHIFHPTLKNAPGRQVVQNLLVQGQNVPKHPDKRWKIFIR